MGRVITIDLRIPQIYNWVELIPENKQEPLQYSICSNGLIVNTYLEDAHEKMSVYSVTDPTQKATYLRDIDLPGIGTVTDVFAEHDSDELFYSFTSFTMPSSSYYVDMRSFKQELYSMTMLAKACPNPLDFTTDQVWYESKDGTKVPMYIVRKKSVLPHIDKKPVQPLTTLLYAYGGFGISTTPYFSVSNLLFMSHMDGIFAVANIRGGGEFGEEWHKASVQEKKQNGFDDFIAAAEYLQDK
jgi:prolyl oligopeptidase